MAGEPGALESRVGAEGGVLLPTEVLRALGLREGDHVRFVVKADGVHLVTPAMLRSILWANNTGGGAGDSAADIRNARMTDQLASERKHTRIAEDPAAADRAYDEVARDLLASLRRPR
jgi:bifunctional DNA-binding transcriptional regulator/antitoxin component of YhaV-PrlF toxin-antitoxin module